MRPASLTYADIEVYRFILAFKKSHNGNSPSMREILEGTGSASTSTVSKSIGKLVKLGYLKMDNSKARNISVPGSVWVLSLSIKEPQAGEEL